MAKKVYIAQFDADGAPYIQTCNKLETRTLSLTKRVESYSSRMTTSLTKMMTVYASLAGTVAFINSSVQAFGEEERAVKRLDVALGQHNKTLKQYASTLQKQTTFADDQILDAMALISNYVKEEGTVKKLTKATLDLAVAKGMDLSTAAELVAKTVGSSTNALGRYGIQIKDNSTGIERINSLLGELAIFQGQAEGQAETYTGKLEQMKNQFGDLQEQIGEGVIPTLSEFSDSLGRIAQNMGTSGISELLDKWIKLMTVIPRNVTMPALEWVSGVFGSGPEPDLTMMNSESFTNSINQRKNKTVTTNNKKGKVTGPVRLNPRNIYAGPNPDLYPAFFGGDASLGGGPVGPGGSAFGAGMNPLQGPEFDPEEFKKVMMKAGDDFLNSFEEISSISNQIANVFNIAGDSFVGKIISAFDTVSQLIGIVGSIMNLAGGGGIGSLFGLAKGGTVINRGGSLSYSPIPKFARGGSFMVPPGFTNDSGLMRVQSGERVDVTPSSQVPVIGKMLSEIKNSIQAQTLNMMRGGGKSQPIVVKVGSRAIARAVSKGGNKLADAGENVKEL